LKKPAAAFTMLSKYLYRTILSSKQKVLSRDTVTFNCEGVE
jgi:hypothetical protein